MDTQQHKHINVDYISEGHENMGARFETQSEGSGFQEIPEFEINSMHPKGVLTDSLPIRAGCFNGEYMAIGTNSKCLKICSIGQIIHSLNSDQFQLQEGDDESIEEVPVIFDQLNHHEGSIYCIDWTECERLIASGSNDKKIKILV